MAEKQKILIADDDPEIREVVRVLLESEGFEVAEAKDGIEAVRMADDSVDLILLDIMMPGQSGFAACLDIRKNTQAPIIFLTAKTQDSDKTMGFSAGGDDYLAKPFSFSELLARVKAALRRYLVYGAKQGGQDSPIQLGEVEINRANRSVTRDGREVQLTDTEYKILLLLAESRKKVFSVQSIYESVWEEPYYYSSNNTVMVHVRNLRRKIGDTAGNEIIRTVWGRGYRIE